MVSKRSDLRNARRNRRFDAEQRRNRVHLEKMMVHESREKITRSAITASGIGSFVVTRSQKFTCAIPIQICGVNGSLSLY
jgi:hypothetical protein